MISQTSRSTKFVRHFSRNVVSQSSAVSAKDVPLTMYFPSTPSLSPVADFVKAETENFKKVEKSKLTNGLTLVSNQSLNKGKSFVGLYVDAGSRFQTYKNEGVAHFTERFFYAGTNQRSYLRLVSDMQKTGADISAQTGREQIVYQLDALREAVPQTLELVSNSVLQGRLLEWDLPPKREFVQDDIEAYGSDPEFVLAELLHATAYGKKNLGRSLICPSHQVDKISAADVVQYMNSLYVPNRMTLVATNFDHHDLTVLAERLFGHLDNNVSSIAPLPSTANESAKYIGGDYEVNAVLEGPEGTATQVILAFEGAAQKDIKHYYALNVLSQLLGSAYNVYVPTLARRESLLQRYVVSKNQNIRQARAFSTSYSDSGLFGVFVQAKNGSAASDAVVSAVDLLKNSAEQITESQLNGAKNATLVQLLAGLESNQGLNEFNAKFSSQDEHIAAIKRITVDDIKQAAKKLLASKPTLVSVGNLDGMIRTTDL